jgi:DNA-binding transcriptional ArsR family regulator
MSLQSNLRPLSALAHPTRWRIVALLLDRPLCVSDLAAILDLRLSNLSNHLKLLRECGVLRVERRGSLCFYRVVDRLHGVISSMQHVFGLSVSCDSVLGADAWKAQASFRS